MTKEEVIEMARQAGLPEAIIEMTPIAFERFATLIAEKEREAIEKRVMELDETMATRFYVINKAIRARGQE